jgi:predicted RNase H-like HicB family nuclease
VNKYPIVIERTVTGFSGYVPDLPGCVAAGATLEETRELLRQGIEIYIETLREDGEPVPPPSIVEMVEVSVA